MKAETEGSSPGRFMFVLLSNNYINNDDNHTNKNNTYNLLCSLLMNYVFSGVFVFCFLCCFVVLWLGAVLPENTYFLPSKMCCFSKCFSSLNSVAIPVSVSLPGGQSLLKFRTPDCVSTGALQSGQLTSFTLWWRND